MTYIFGRNLVGRYRIAYRWRQKSQDRDRK